MFQIFSTLFLSVGAGIVSYFLIEKLWSLARNSTKAISWVVGSFAAVSLLACIIGASFVLATTSEYPAACVLILAAFGIAKSLLNN